MNRLINKTLALCLLCTGFAHAGEALVQSAIDKKDYTLAFAAAKADVKDGTATDVERLLLAQMYANGQGTEKDLNAARDILKPLVNKNMPEAQFILAGMLQSEAVVGLKSSDGQLNLVRFKELAQRPLSERENERYAAELVYKAALQNFQPAVEAVCMDLDNAVIAFGGTERANWYRKCNKESWAKASEMGQSLVPLNLRRDVLRDPVIGEAFAQQAVKASCLDENIKPVDFKIGKPVTGGEYLTLQLDKPKQYKMIRGQWQEIWIGQACGKQFAVPIIFKADGMGGAGFAPDVSPEQLELLIKAALPK
ncbi:sel1 repeat family protein [Chitinibacter bivalviorum]|uniref:Sel1 repeat family protein n=1 Tax=Chitinibacter bivalviorum TaxID=2739434 RepID=A0A7H9BJU4_9NEIS|nr:sel1 repeat family protein [Chitinibacter bivalviorum]QLG88642.1 sel1 repeat family protein [Chitinibacter bivalviorum]